MNLFLPSRIKTALWLIVFFSVTTRFWNLNHPAEMYFDEIYHVPAARLIANNDERAYEWWHQPIAGNDYHDWLHPPLVKLIQAGSIKLLGDNPLGWRMPSAVFGVALVVAIYFFADRIFQVYYPAQSKKIALLSATIVAMDGLVLVQSRIAMNDVFLSFWMIVALLSLSLWQPKIWLLKFDRFKQKEKITVRQSSSFLVFTGLFLGLALASKWSAVLLILALLFLTISVVIESKMLRSLPLILFSLIILPLSIYFLSYSQMFLQGKGINDFFELHKQIFWYQINRDSDHDYSSLSHQWILNSRPVWYWTEDFVDRADKNHEANIYLLGNPVIHFLAVIALIYRLGELIVSWNDEKKLSFKLSIFLLFVVLLLPWSLSPRIVFYHLYLPAFLILSLILSDFLINVILKRSSLIFWLVILLIIIAFVTFYPHWTGIPVNGWIAEKIYFAFPSWK